MNVGPWHDCNRQNAYTISCWRLFWTIDRLGHGLHGLQERCARWLLMTLERVDADRFAVTKEFLAQLLGTNRPTVSVLVSVLEKAGILNVEGRLVTVADRDRLKEAACECYDVIRKGYEAVGR